MNAGAPSALAARLTDGLDRAWARGVLPYPSLDPDVLETAAARGAGHDDFGDDHGWRARLRLLTTDLESGADLNPIGRTIAHGQIVKLLRDRLAATRLWRARPEILDRPIRAPIVILGHMRSGTTRLHRLLACDRGLAHTRCFETMSPIPRDWPDLRPIRVAAGLRVLRALNPALAAVHPTDTHAPEEEFGLLAFALSGAMFEAQWRVPGFARHCEVTDPAPIYREFDALLRTIRWNQGGDDRPWLLKAPQFMQDLAGLIAQFPDARLLCLSRDPAAVAGSSASLAWQQMRVQSNSVTREWVGREWLRKIGRRAEAAATARAAHPAVPQLDIDYAAIDADWLGEIRRIYAFLDRPLERDTEAAMARYVAGSARHAHHRHRYRLADFGISEEDVALA